MNFFGKKDLIYLLVIALLALSAVFFAFKGEISESKYESYRAKILNGALECSIQLLGEYVETGDHRLSPFLASRLGELPLGDEERETVTEFCRDVSRSSDDADAERRSKIYAGSLMTALIENRSAIKRGDMTSVPRARTPSMKTASSCDICASVTSGNVFRKKTQKRTP